VTTKTKKKEGEEVHYGIKDRKKGRGYGRVNDTGRDDLRMLQERGGGSE